MGREDGRTDLRSCPVSATPRIGLLLALWVTAAAQDDACTAVDTRFSRGYHDLLVVVAVLACCRVLGYVAECWASHMHPFASSYDVFRYRADTSALWCTLACDVLYSAIQSETSSGGRCEAECQGPCVTQILAYLSSCEAVPEHSAQTSVMASFINECQGTRSTGVGRTAYAASGTCSPSWQCRSRMAHFAHCVRGQWLTVV